jgi:hypothetical protein
MRIDPLYIWLAALAIISGIFYIICLHAGAVELSITGSATGQGIQNLSFVGDALNVSILQNSSFQGWNVTLGASA